MSRHKTPQNIIESIAAKRQILKDLLPFGSGVEIAKRAGVSKNSVCSYWKGVGNHVGIRKAINELLDKEDKDIISEDHLIEKAQRLKARLLKK